MSDGVATQSYTANATPGLLCISSHLTEWGGMYFPDSAAEFGENLEPYIPSAEDFISGGVDFDAQPMLWGIVFGLAAINAVFLPLFWIKLMYRAHDIGGHHRRRQVLALVRRSSWRDRCVL